MKNKTVLVIGGSSGIGKKIHEYLKNLNYDVFTVSRSGNPNFRGDVTDENFRNFLYKNIVPDILIYSAGIMSKNISDMYKVNTVAAADVIFNYYKLMSAGSDIIVISSIAATMSENMFVPDMIEMNAYASSKKSISDFAVSLSKNRQKDVRVSVIEPNDVRPTNIHSSRKTKIPDENYSNFDFKKITPIKTSYIAEICNWIINQPRWITISKIIIENNYIKN